MVSELLLDHPSENSRYDPVYYFAATTTKRMDRGEEGKADGKEPLARRHSTSSSQGSSVMSGWTLLNAHGSEIESSSVQTEKGAIEKMQSSASSSAGSDFVEVSGGVSEMDGEGESLLESFLRSSSLAVPPQPSQPLVPIGVEEDKPSCSHHSNPSYSKADTKKISSDESSGSEEEVGLGREKEFLEGARQRHPLLRQGYSLDSEKVAQLLDALANAVDSHHSGGGMYSEDLPVNFVQMCSNKIKNYMHTKNGRLNWKLSLLLTLCIALVLGLGLGHFIGTTTSWLRRHRVAKQQVEQLKTLQDGLVTCLGKLETVDDKLEGEILGLKQQLSACRSLSGHCAADDKPSCHAPHDSLQTDVETCRLQLKFCQTEMEEIEEGLSRKAVSNRWALSRLGQLQRDAALREDANTGWVKARSRQRITERNLSFLKQRLLKLRNEMNSERSRTKEDNEKYLLKIEDQEIDIDMLLGEVDTKNEKIKELESALDEARKREEVLITEKTLSSDSSGTESEGESCENKGDGLSLPHWLRLEFVKEALSSGNITTLIQSYLTYFQAIDFEQIANDSNQIISAQLNQLSEIVAYLKSRVDSQLGDENSEKIKTGVETGLSQVWDYTRNTALWASENGPKEVGKLVNMLSSDVLMRLKGITEGMQSEDTAEMWSVRSSQLFDDFVHHNEGDSNSDQFIENDGLISPVTKESNSASETAGTEMPNTGPTQSITVPCQPLSAGRIEEEQDDIYELRYLLKKKSTLRYELPRQEFEDYIDELKRMARGIKFDGEKMKKWMCHKNFWNLCPQSECQDHSYLKAWQLAGDSDQQELKVFLEENALVSDAIVDWSSDEIIVEEGRSEKRRERGANKQRKYVDGRWDWRRGRGRAGIRAAETRSDWVFDRSRDRERLRKADADGYESTEWLFRRGKKRKVNDCWA